MKLKKTNAVIGLLSILFLLVHVGYNIFCYLAFYYNPELKLLTAVPFIVCACLHAFLGMAAVFTQADGTRADLYPGRNMGTLLQRIAAAAIFPLLILHLRTFGLLRDTAAGGQWLRFGLLIVSQVLFYGTVMTHICTSLSKALITLGWLSSRTGQKRLDRIVYFLGAVLFLLALYAVIRGEIAMIPRFQAEGGAA